MADVLKQELGINAELSKGSNGIFTIAVDGDIVAKKTLEGFPTPEQVVAAVRAKL